jgi:DNA polymerase III gamma/tau subunit
LRYSTQGRTLAEMALVRIAELENLADLANVIAELRDAAPAGGPATAPPGARTESITTPAAAAKKKETELNGDPTPEDTPSPARKPHAAQPLDEASVQNIWRETLANLSDLLADNAAKAESIALAGEGRLAATFRAKYTSCKSFCERDAQRATLENALAEVAGQPIRVVFLVIDDEPTSETARAAVPQRQHMATVAEHPLVARTGELFGARVVRVDRAENE